MFNSNFIFFFVCFSVYDFYIPGFYLQWIHEKLMLLYTSKTFVLLDDNFRISFQNGDRRNFYRHNIPLKIYYEFALNIFIFNSHKFSLHFFRIQFMPYFKSQKILSKKTRRWIAKNKGATEKNHWESRLNMDFLPSNAEYSSNPKGEEFQPAFFLHPAPFWNR